MARSKLCGGIFLKAAIDSFADQARSFDSADYLAGKNMQLAGSAFFD
jgi:hypothetical protein